MKDPNHSAKSAGGMLHLNTHAFYIYDFAWSDVVVHGGMVYIECTKTAAASHGTSHVTTKQCYKYTTSVDIENML